MAIECQQERESAAVDALEEGAFAKSHHALSGSAEIFEQLLVAGGGIGSLRLVLIPRKTVARQAQFFHQCYHVAAIQSAILVALHRVEFDGLRNTVGEI